MTIFWPFWSFFHQLHWNLSQNWGPNGHFEVLSMFWLQLDQDLTHKIGKTFTKNASFQGVVCRSEFWQDRRKPALIFSKWPFFSKFLRLSWDIWSGQMQVKNRINFLNFWLIKKYYVVIIFWIETEYTFWSQKIWSS